MQSFVSYVITIVGFFVGIIGLALAFQGPSKDFVEKTIRAAVKDASTQSIPHRESSRMDESLRDSPTGQH